MRERLESVPWRLLEPFIVFALIVGFAKLNWDPSTEIMVTGALIGLLTALTAVGLALIYRANRIVNFAQGDLGVIPALLVLLLMANDIPGGAWDWMTSLPYIVAFLVGLGAAILLGFVVERTIINRFKKSPRLILTVATIGLSQLLIALSLAMLPWFGFKGLSATDLAPDPPFDFSHTIGVLTFDENDLLVFVTVPLLLTALALFLRYTRVGIAIRATAERADRASTLGVPVPRIQTSVWVITTVLAFVAVFLRAGVLSFPFGSALGITVLVRALAAAVIGRMERFATITAAAIALGILEQAIVYDTGKDAAIFPWLFAIIVIALLAQRRSRASRVEDQQTSNWQVAREMKPVPTEMRRLPEVRLAAWVLSGGIAALVLSLPLWMSNRDLSIAVNTGVLAIIGVSLVVLTGWAGHVSLGQMAFAAIGGAVGGWVTQNQGWDLGIALVVGGTAGAVAAVVVGIPAARAGGLTLAIITLAFASAVLFWLLNPNYFSWVPQGFFEQPELFGTIAIDTETRYYWLTLALLAASIAMAYGIRRSRTGRVLIALRENPRASEAYGINSMRTSLTAFAFSGFLAAVAGVIYVHHVRQLSDAVIDNPFDAAASLRVLTIVVIGGLASIPGALLGALYVTWIQYYLTVDSLRFLANGFGLLLVLFILPGGLGAGLGEARDACLRWLARRKNLLVPSLLADRRVDDALAATPEMAAAIADAVERPEVEEIVEMGT